MFKYRVLAAVVVPLFFAHVNAASIGAMPRPGAVDDSSSIMPAADFTTGGSVAPIYSPTPPPVVVTPPPPPASSSPTSFVSTAFTCSVPSGVGTEGAREAVLPLYNRYGGRCADTGGLQHWSTTLYTCVQNQGNDEATMRTLPGWWFVDKTGECGIDSGILGNIQTSADQTSMDKLCSDDAATRAYQAPGSYRYVRGTSSATCSL